MGSTYVGHDRRCETVSARSARLAATVLPIHLDRHYRRQQLGAPGPRRRQAADVRNTELQCLAELGLTEIRRERSPLAAWKLRRELDRNARLQLPPERVDQADR